ncbi:MAG: Asp-tRNA(Asn)/Glu-tRNA(Gln) amidotransferase GatCAB subunit C [Bacilli bacterium]|nr:Asp-tRNA(Asn)/Glu-tRNA(Gln) amidotransferase GatCAB subunit C [Bacilli bacterium]
MKEINKNVLIEASEKLLFKMEDSEYETLLKEFDVITIQMTFLSNLKGVEDVQPMTFPFACKTTFLREDVASKPLDRDEALKNAGDVVEGQIRLPKGGRLIWVIYVDQLKRFMRLLFLVQLLQKN